MSGIGDYIHYRAINYVKFGTGRAPNYGPTTANWAVADQKARLMEVAKISKSNGLGKDGKKFARYIEWLMRPPDARSNGYPDGESAELYNLAWEALVPFLEQEFGYAADRISRASGNIFALIGGVNGFNKIKIKKEQKSIYASTIVKRLDMIEQALSKGSYSVVDKLTGNTKDVRYTESELNELQTFYTKLMVMKRQLSQEVQSKLDAVQIQQNGKVRQVLQNAQLDIPLDQSIYDFVNQINSLSSLGRGAAAQYKGQLFEWMVVAAAYIAQGLSGDALKEAIAVGIGNASALNDGIFNTSWTGKNTTSVQYDSKDFISSADLSKILSNNYQQVGDLYVANNATQDKVDVQISMPSTGIKTLNLSIKNKNLTAPHAQPVDLVKDSPLLVMLASLQNHEFVNHYLNQHMEHAYRADTTYLMNKASFAYNETARVLTLSIVERAFRGYKQNAAKADIFVINDNITGKVQIIDMADILTDLLTMDMNSMLSYVKIQPDLMTLTFPNTWSENSAEDRINKILANIHNMKVVVNIASSYFSKNLNISI